MRKYGKYEKRPEKAKVPEAKSAILQTYFTSLMCLVLCVSMFFGTSFAWFTSEVNNVGNEIYIGTLDVNVYKRVGDVQEDLNGNNYKFFDGNIRWEPGYTALETIQIQNAGDLAFKYVLSFTDGTLAEGNKLPIETVAEFFEVWVFDHSEKEYSKPVSFEAIKAADSGWNHAGSLAQILAGASVLEGEMKETDVRTQKETQPVTNEAAEAADEESSTEAATEAVTEPASDIKNTTHTYTIALHMSDDADSSVMGHKISLNVKLVAYQLTSEQDAFGTGTYDEIVAVSGLSTLKTALASGGNTLLATDIALKTAEERVTMAGGVLDGNKHKITYGGEKVSDSSVGVVTTSGGTVRYLTIEGGENGRALYATKLESDLVVSNCTLSGAYAFNLNSADKTDYELKFTGTIFNSWTSYANVVKHAYFTKCDFKNVLKPYGDTTLTNCNFAEETLDVSALEAGETITLINCTYKGQLIEKAVLTSNGETVVISESDALTVNEAKLVVLASAG